MEVEKQPELQQMEKVRETFKIYGINMPELQKCVEDFQGGTLKSRINGLPRLFFYKKNPTIFLCKTCLLGQTKRKGTLLTIFGPSRIFQPPPPAYYILHKFPTPLLIRTPLVYLGP